MSCDGCAVWIFELLYVLCAIALSLYGLNSLLLTALYVWHRRDPAPHHSRRACRRTVGPRARGAAEPEWPHVTVQLPVYNELHTVERLLAAVAALDYPPDRLQIQALDDSTDGTRALVVKQARPYSFGHAARPADCREF